MNFIVTPVVITFAILKDLVWTSVTEERIAACRNYKIMVHTLFVIISIACVFAVLLIITLFAILKWLVHLHLRRKFGERYGGILDGHSVQFEAYDKEKASIVTVMIVLVSTSYTKFHNQLKSIISRICFEDEKILSRTVEYFCGYYYYLNNRFTWEDILSEISTTGCKVITPMQLFDYLEKYDVTSGKLWEVIVFKQPIIWNYIRSRTTYAVIVRVNHCIMDADAISALLKEYFFDERHPEHCKCVQRHQSTKLDDAYVIYNPFHYLFNMEVNLNTHPAQHLTVVFEDKPLYIPLIKTMKKKLDVPFSLILLAGISSALGDCMRKKTFGWKKVNIVYNIRTSVTENDELCETRNHNSRYSFISFVVSLQEKACTPLQHLRYITEAYNFGKGALDAKLLDYLKNSVFHYVPFGIFQRSYYEDLFQQNTLYFTSFVQMEEESIDGHKVIDAFGYFPLYQNKGIMLTALTYNHRLELSLISREDVISNREDLIGILINTLQYIDDLCRELIMPSIENKYT